MKKLLCLLLAVATVLALSVVPAMADAVEINMFIPSPEYADAVNELIAAYKEVAPDVTINYETTQNDYPTLLKSRINAGTTPDIFGTTSGKEIADYAEYSYNFAGSPAAEAMDPAVAAMMVYGDGEIHGFALKGNYFGMLYNKAIFDEVGLEFPKTLDDFEAACEKLAEAGYQPVTTGFAEWWVFKHVMQHFLDAASDDPAALVAAFQAGEAHIKDYPVLYDNFFRFIDLCVKYGGNKPLETDLAGEVSAFGTGKAAMVIGQGPWVEADVLAIDDAHQQGFRQPGSRDGLRELVVHQRLRQGLVLRRCRRHPADYRREDGRHADHQAGLRAGRRGRRRRAEHLLLLRQLQPGHGRGHSGLHRRQPGQGRLLRPDRGQVGRAGRQQVIIANATQPRRTLCGAAESH